MVKQLKIFLKNKISSYILYCVALFRVACAFACLCGGVVVCLFVCLCVCCLFVRPIVRVVCLVFLFEACVCVCSRMTDSFCQASPGQD